MASPLCDNQDTSPVIQSAAPALNQVIHSEKNTHEIIARSEAAERGLKWYFTGVACGRGHIAKRSLSNRECRRCVDDRDMRNRAFSPDLWREADRDRYHRNVDKKRAQMKASRQRHLEQRRAYDRERYHSDPQRQEYQRKQAGEWWKSNKGKFNFGVARRRAWVKRATPPWLTQEHKKQIRAMYVEAAARDGEWHVDHIDPLRSKLVCGLNVPWNLQIIPGPENRRKGNAFTPT